MGILLALLAAVCWGSGALMTRKAVERLRPTVSVAVSVLSGFLVVMTLALIFHWRAVWELPGRAFLWFLLAGFLNFFLSRHLNFISIRLAGVSRGALLGGTYPLFALLFAIAFAGEKLTVPVLLGTLAVVGGVALIMSGGRR
ncbi:MAG: DMT family transporter [Chloroflexi bacterium]|nr:DMT family transporter [Chloroflexota bacterium]